MSEPADKPPAPAKVPTLGSIAMELRQGAGITRRIFGDQVNLGELDVRRWEEGRLRLGVESLQRILRHPAMRDLPARAAAAGIGPGDLKTP